MAKRHSKTEQHQAHGLRRDEQDFYFSDYQNYSLYRWSYGSVKDFGAWFAPMRLRVPSRHLLANAILIASCLSLVVYAVYTLS